MARLFAILLFPILCHSAWLKFETSNFEVYSSAGAAAGRDVLRRLEQVRTVFEERTGQRRLAPLPVRVVVFASEPDFRSFELRRSAAGFYHPGTDRDYIAILGGAADLHRVAAHEYIHLLLRHAGGTVPPWLNEGIADAWSTLNVRGVEVRAGDPIPTHMEKLRTGTLLPIQQLFRSDASNVPYPQSWAFVHLMAFAEPYRSGFPLFVSLVLTGTEPESAVHVAFHRTPREVEQDLTTYVQRARFPAVSFPTHSAGVGVSVEPQTISALEADLIRWELLVATEKYDPSDELLRRLDPADSKVQHALGDAAQRRKEDAQALKHYRRAIELGSRSAQLRYDYAMVRRTLGASDGELIPDLREAVALEGRLFDPQFLLGYLLLKSGNRAEAVEPLRASVKLRPWSATAREQLALAESPPDPEWRETVPERSRTPELPQLRGSMTQVDCLGEKARIHVVANGGKTFLLVRDPANVLLHNAGSAWTQFPCGPVTHQAVVVAYRPVVNASYGTTGEVASITFEGGAR